MLEYTLVMAIAEKSLTSGGLRSASMEPGGRTSFPFKLTLSDLRDIRKECGPGWAGKSAFRLLAYGSGCEAKDEVGEACGIRARETLDFDVHGQLEQFPSCGREHTLLMRDRIQKDLGERRTVFGKNGRGRG